jgi:hypothetical protein
MNIRFRFSPLKAYEAIRFMLTQHDRLDVHTILKACYFADKAHLNKHFQPIFGATYQAMVYGPVPLEIYELIKGEAIRLNELGFDNLPWELQGFHVVRKAASTGSNRECFSATEIAELELALKKSVAMNFTQRTAITHGQDWQNANGGIMQYEDMLEDSAQKAENIRNLQETAQYIRL